jgi:outer membrane protein with beta-barrel domain
MRVVTVSAVLLAVGAATLHAQHHFQFEIGGFGAYSRFDRTFQLDNQIGGGGRIAFWITDWLGIEGDGVYQRPHATGGGAGTAAPVWFASGSIVLNFGSEKSFYVLGGYSAMDFNSSGPGGFRDVGVHGAFGDRIYISDRAALRLEARAYYVPNSQLPGTSWVGHVVGSAGLSFFLGPSHRESPYPEIPKERRDSIVAAGGAVPEARPRGGPTYEKRSSDWQHKWYWGGEAGLMMFRTNFDNYAFEPTFGGHWLITGKRTALYASFEQSLFISPRHVTIVEPSGTVSPGNVSFNNLRRIMVGVLAFPAQLRVEPFGGGGFAIMQALNVQASCSPGCTGADLAQLQEQADNAATKAFFWWMGGVDIKQGRLALYGHYILTSAAANFLIQGTTHTFQGGVRYSLGSAKEGVTDRQ